MVTFCGVSNKSFVHGCTYAAIAWMRRSSELTVKGEANYKKRDKAINKFQKQKREPSGITTHKYLLIMLLGKV